MHDRYVLPVPGEPTVEAVRAGVAAAAREHGADVIAAIGGGSMPGNPVPLSQDDLAGIVLAGL